MQYAIPTKNYEALLKRMNQVQAKCAKYGCEFRFEEVGREMRKVKSRNGESFYIWMTLVEAEGTAIVNGWRFIGSIEHTPNGNIIRTIGNTEVPSRFYTTQAICEHCNTIRPRKDTYLIQHESGEFKQVGKSCLRDFTNGMSAEGVAACLSILRDIEDSGESYGNPCWAGEQYMDTDEFLRFAAETVRIYGYQGRNDRDEQTTAWRALDFITLANGGFCSEYDKDKRALLEKEVEATGFDPNTAEIAERVEKARAWAQELDDSNGYLHNLKVACTMNFVTRRHIGILSSLFTAYDRAHGVSTKRQTSTSEWVGSVNDKITLTIKSVECVASWEGNYGLTRVYKITDENGNIYTWKTTTFIENGMTTLTGTIKAHTEFRGIKQTELTRCRVA